MLGPPNHGAAIARLLGKLKLFGLLVGEESLQFLVGLVRHLSEQPPRKLFPKHRQGLEQGLLFGGEPVDARGQHTLHRGRQLQCGEGTARHRRH